MLKSATTQDFKYPNYLSGRKGTVSGRTSSTSNSSNQSEFNAFSQNMNAVIQLPEGYTNVYAYNKAGELHGKSENQSVNGKELSFMTLVGNSNQEELVFYIGDGDSKKQTSKSINFVADSLLGTVSDPFIIDETTMDLTKAHFLLYPNPSKDGFVYLEFYAQNKQNTQVMIYNVLNQLLFNSEFSIKQGYNVLKIPVNFQNGTYFLNTTIDNEPYNNKLILK